MSKLTKLIGACLIAGAINASPALAAQKVQKVIVGETGGLVSVVGRTLELFKKRAEKYSDNGLKVEIYPNSQLGTFSTMATQMKVNLVNVMFIQPDALGQQIKIVTANSWPFLFTNGDQMLKAWKGPGGKALIAAVEKRSGYRMIAPSWNVPRWIYTTRQVKSLKGVKGMKIRVPGTAIYVDQIRLLGLSPTPMNIHTTFTAMQQKVVEGIEGAITDMDNLSIEEVAKTAIMTGHVLSPKAFLTYGPWVDKLTSRNKEAFYKAAREASAYYSKTTKADEKQLIAKFRRKGVKFVEPGLSIQQMRQLEEPLKKKLPKVWKWAKILSGK